MDDMVVWLTYDELAERLGIERESARQQVKRKHWARRPGNDGKVRIGVPVEVFGSGSEEGTEGGADPVQAPVHEPAPAPAYDPAVFEVLTRHIERLEQQLEISAGRASDRDIVAAERDVLRVQVEALRDALLVAEQDRDRWHNAVLRMPNSQERHANELRALQERVAGETAQARAELEAWKARPWWRRMAG